MTKTEEKKVTKRLNEVMAHLPPICSQFIEKEAAKKSKQTRLGYAYDLKVYTDYLSTIYGNSSDKTVREATPSDIARYIDSLKEYTSPSGNKRRNTDKGIFRKTHTIKAFYDYAHDNRKVLISPAEDIQFPKLKRRNGTKVPAECALKLMAAVKPKKDAPKSVKVSIWNDELLRNRAIIALVIGTTLTNGQIAELDIDDVNLDEAKLFIKDSQKTIGIDERAAHTIRNYLNGVQGQPSWNREKFRPAEGDKALFLSRKRVRIAVRTIQYLLLSTINEVFGNDENPPKANEFKGALAEQGKEVKGKETDRNGRMESAH